MAQIVTTHSGMYYVMQFARWGMSDACPVFQVYEKYDGPVGERRGRGMVRADKLARSYPGKEHHDGFDDYIDHPDAIIMVAARNALPELLDTIERQADENALLLQAVRKYARLPNTCMYGRDCVEVERDHSACAECSKWAFGLDGEVGHE